MDFGEERIERVRLGDGVFLRGDRRRRRRRRRARRRAGIRACAISGGVVSGVEDEFTTARDLDERWVLCAKKASSIVSTRRSRREPSRRPRARSRRASRSPRAALRRPRVASISTPRISSVRPRRVPSDIVPSSHILAEVRRALIDAGAPADIADDAPLMASGLASAGAAAAHAAMERAFGAPSRDARLDRPTVTDVAAFVHSAVRCVSNDDEAHTATLTIDDALDSAVRDALGLDASAAFPDEDAPLASVGLAAAGRRSGCRRRWSIRWVVDFAGRSPRHSRSIDPPSPRFVRFSSTRV